MAELPQREQLALHEFSVRYRLAHAKEHPILQSSLDTVTEALRDQYEQEQQAKRSPSVDSSSPEPEHDRQQPEPEEPEP